MAGQSPVGILLAAGFGRRFDPDGLKNKLLQLLDNGVPVAVQSSRNQLQALSQVVAVAQSPALAAHLTELGCQVLMFSDAGKGMGASLAFGVRHVVSNFPEAGSVLIGLADMPWIRPDTVALVAGELKRGADIVQPVFENRVGHPVGFSRRHFAAMMALQDDFGARHIMREFPVTQLAVDDPGVIQDIDHPSDLPAR